MLGIVLVPTNSTDKAKQHESGLYEFRKMIQLSQLKVYSYVRLKSLGFLPF